MDDAGSAKLKGARSDINATFKYFGSKGYSLVEVKEHSDLKIFPVSSPKIAEANIGKHRTFGQFHYMNHRMFNFKPNMLAVDFNLKNTVKFMILGSEAKSQGKIKKTFSYRLQGSEGIQIDSLKNWIYDRTVLSGLINFDTLEHFYGLPAPVSYSKKLRTLFGYCGDDLEKVNDLLGMINNFGFETPMYLSFCD